MNAQAGIRANILGNKLMGSFSKVDNTTEILVMPSAAKFSMPMTPANVAAEINKLIANFKGEDPAVDDPVNPEMITKVLKMVGLENASLSFTQIFFHYKKEEPATPGGGEATVLTEFAIGILLDSNESPTFNDFTFLAIDKVYVNLWNTTNPDVLEKMKIWTPLELE